MTDTIHFGTDGWRAIIGKDFTESNLARVVEAAAAVFKEESLAAGYSPNALPVLLVGHDCRQDAHRFAQLAAGIAAAAGFTVMLSHDYCPTPALCWSIAHNEGAIGGIMLTSSHNPAEYLGVKLRMADGGASPKDFTDRVEALLPESPLFDRSPFTEVDFIEPYLEALRALVDAEAINKAKLKVVVDPLYGAGRIHLANLLRDLGVEVVEINNADDPSFDGLHPEPIPPWIDRGITKVQELGFDAVFITDGDADRIGAIDARGLFVNPHRILTLLVAHLAEDKGLQGRVVSTITSSALLARQCKRLGLDLTSTPVGFKWIYGEMEKGDVMIGGEESGGIGIPTHVKERDGLLMALLLTEMMAERKMGLHDLVEQMFSQIGRLEFLRQGLTLAEEQMEVFRTETVTHFTRESLCGKRVVEIDRRDGIKFSLEDDAWVMMRPSGTEPLVRIYAEAATNEEVEALLEAATIIVKGPLA
ncbi:MAG: phosphoglucomutase/phosphomannomutase family protein [Coriobacteriaceae bacterium]|jgi:phosphomannomutase|nr:phosphoglucomutase/phosphomannomutase family protein [Coriobacteriaceae bacterium]